MATSLLGVSLKDFLTGLISSCHCPASGGGLNLHRAQSSSKGSVLDIFSASGSYEKAEAL